MTLRFRLTIIIAFIIVLITFFTSIAIYLLSSNHREQDFYTRLRAEAKVVFDDYLDKMIDSTGLIQKLPQELDDKTLYNKQITILTGDNKVLSSIPKQNTLRLSEKQLRLIKQKKEVDFDIKTHQVVGLYLENYDEYIIVAAYDKDGLEKQGTLKFFLAIVSTVAIIITLLLTYFFAGAALKPLTNLSNQISNTDVRKLEFIDSGQNKKDEIGTIAHNYNALMQRLQTAFEEQKNFIHHASHELRTPLATMFATTEAALHKEMNVVEFKKTLLSLKEDQNHLIELTNSLLLLSQFEKLQTNPKWSKLRIDDLLIEAMSYCQKLFTGLTVDFEFTNVPDDDSWLIINGNETLLKSAFTNLIKNAFLYSDDKRIRIIVEATAKNLVVHFDSMGKNLSELQIENLTKPFYQHNNVGSTKGFGLGLSIVERIINLHNAKFIYTPLSKMSNRFSIGFK